MGEEEKIAYRFIVGRHDRLLLTKYCSGDKIKNEMGGACSAYWGERRGVCRGNLREIVHLGDPGIDGRIILRWILRKWDVGLWTGSSWLRRGTVGGHL